MATYVPIQPYQSKLPSYLQTLKDVYALESTKQDQQNNAQLFRDRDFEYQQKQQAWQDQQAVRKAYLDNMNMGGGVPPAATPQQPSTLGQQMAGPAAPPQQPVQVTGQQAPPVTGQQGVAGPGSGPLQGLVRPTFNQQGFEDQVARTAPMQLTGIQQQRLAQQEAQARFHKEQLDGLTKKYGVVSQIANGMTDQTSYTRGVSQLIKEGAINPGEAPALYDAGLVGQWQAAGQTATEHLATAQAQRDELEKARHSQADEANAALQHQQLGWYQQQEARARQQELQLRGQQVNIEGGRLALDRQKNTFDQNGNVEAQARQIASYDLPELSQARNNNFNRAVMARVLELNPSYSKQGYTTRQDFLTPKGKMGTQVYTLNKVAEHLNDLQSASDQAGTVLNPWGGNAKALHTAQQVFTTEEIKNLAGTGIAPEGEIHGLVSNLDSPFAGVRDKAAEQLRVMTASAARQVGDVYTRGTQMPFDSDRFFNPKTVQLMRTHGGLSSGSHWSQQPGPALARPSVTPSSNTDPLGIR